MKYGIGDTVSVKDVYGDLVTGRVEIVYTNAFIINVAGTYHVVRKKDLKAQGDTVSDK